MAADLNNTGAYGDVRTLRYTYPILRRVSRADGTDISVDSNAIKSGSRLFSGRLKAAIVLL